MTVTQVAPLITYSIAGTSGETFAIPFEFSANSDIVAHTIDADGVPTLLAITTNYTLTGAGDNAGGELTAVGSFNAGETLRIERWTPIVQDSPLPISGPFLASTVEQMIDECVMMIQNLAQRLGGLDYSIGRGQYLGRSIADVNLWDALNDRIGNVADPTADQDAATKAFVASQINASNTELSAPTSDDIGKVLTAIAAGAGGFDWRTIPTRNLLTNGDFRIAQRGESITSTTVFPNNDGGYTLDRWKLLSDGNDIVDVFRVIAGFAPADALNACRLEVETANKRFALAQYIEAVVSFQNKSTDTVSLSFQARASGIANMRAAAIAWSGTADAITSDIISAWNTSGTDPTLVANAAYCNTPSNLALTASYQQFTIENITIPPGTNNLIVMLWCDDADAAINDTLDIGDVQLNDGEHAQPFHRRATSDIIADCKRYFDKSFSLDVEPGSATDNGMLENFKSTANTTRLNMQGYFKSVMRTPPTMQVYSRTTGAAATVHNATDVADEAAHASNIGDSGFQVQIDIANADPDRYQCHWTANAEL